MKAILHEAFEGPLQVASVADPVLEPHGVVAQVKASGICRSDWHGWMGHDPSIRLPHVPGHELAGVVCAVGVQRGMVKRPRNRMTDSFRADAELDGMPSTRMLRSPLLIRPRDD